jgi:hypothetical protein
MLILDSPAVIDGIEAWKKWLEELQSLEGRFPNDRGLKSEMARAQKILLILERYPEGMSVDHPDFRKVVRELSKQ